MIFPLHHHLCETLRKSIWNEVQHHFILCCRNAAQDQKRQVFVCTGQDIHKGYLRGLSLTPKCSHIYRKDHTWWVICTHLKTSFMWSNILTLSSSLTPVFPSINVVILIILRNLLPSNYQMKHRWRVKESSPWNKTAPTQNRWKAAVIYSEPFHRTQSESLPTLAFANIISVYEPCAEQSGSTFTASVAWPAVDTWSHLIGNFEARFPRESELHVAKEPTKTSPDSTTAWQTGEALNTLGGRSQSRPQVYHIRNSRKSGENNVNWKKSVNQNTKRPERPHVHANKWSRKCCFMFAILKFNLY